MAHIGFDGANVAINLLQKARLLFGRPMSGPLDARESPSARLTDGQALGAFSRLSGEQLLDIGVYRKLRRRKWDLFDRSLSPECKPVFDYFRLGG